MTDRQAKRLWTHPEHLRLSSYEVTRCSACGMSQRRSKDNWRIIAPHTVYVYLGSTRPNIVMCPGCPP